MILGCGRIIGEHAENKSKEYLFNNNIKWKIGIYNTIKFWDNWCLGEVSFKTKVSKVVYEFNNKKKSN